MSRGKNSSSEWLVRETERLLREGRKEIRRLDLSEREARRNIHNFLAHLQQFNDPWLSRSGRQGSSVVPTKLRRAEK